MKWPWNRNKQPKVDVQVPPEVEEYYQSTQKDRRGMAWLLAFGALILTVLIAVALFFAGRWAYRTLVSDDNTGSEQVTQDQPESQDGEVTEESVDQETSGTVTEPEENTDSSEGEITEPNESESLPTGPTNEASENDSDSNTTSTPVTGPSDIPRTGPTEE